MALSGYYDVSRYAAASLVLYGVASVAARRGCVRGDGAVKQALVYVAAVMLQRAFWATVRGGRVDWASEACYWVSAFCWSNGLGPFILKQ
ncbi:hypothetical protein PVAP13_6KG245024 [Panicum virgatum]|uniref:Uncharacterized protein n=1 Tax=Panicum virgatum TaxID=38727 RepID=A0A8T0REQ8_PANVG|nr:hypothetical protein PVAP13_6KG245024 [Panicum virgatum]